MTAEEWNTFFAGHWNFTGARQNGHIAMFPEELQTTSLAAENLERNSIGFKINQEFLSIIKDKLEVHQKHLLGTTYEFYMGVPLSGRAFRSNLFSFPQKRIFTSIPNAA